MRSDLGEKTSKPRGAGGKRQADPLPFAGEPLPGHLRTPNQASGPKP